MSARRKTFYVGVVFLLLGGMLAPLSAAERNNVQGRVFGVQGRGGEINYQTMDLSGHSPGTAASRSALVPGWGQTFNHEPAKGALFFSAFAVSAVGSYILYNKARDSRDFYEARGVRDDPSLDDYNRQRNQSLLLGGIAVLVWGLGIVDAYRNAYNPFYSDASPLQLALNENGGTVIWQKKF